VTAPREVTVPDRETPAWCGALCRAGGDTKTRKSRRTIALPKRCVDALNWQREQQAADRAKAGAQWKEHGLVFASKVGTPLDPSHVWRDFRNAIRDAKGMAPAQWTPRELRHSFVSLLSDSGMPLEEVSRLVGHSITAATELVYRMQIRPVVQAGAVAMDRIFRAWQPRTRFSTRCPLEKPAQGWPAIRHSGRHGQEQCEEGG
jgi:integrase